MHLLEIIKLQFGNNAIHRVFSSFFRIIVAELSLKNAWLPPIFVWIPIALAKIYFSRTVINRAKNTSL